MQEPIRIQSIIIFPDHTDNIYRSNFEYAMVVFSFCAALRHEIHRCIPLGCHKYIEIGWKQDNGSPFHSPHRHRQRHSWVLMTSLVTTCDGELFAWFVSSLCSSSTGFTSVHGESPSAEYAKLRKESLESEFGHALGANRSRSFSAAYRFGPFLALYRASIISFHVLKLTIWQFFVQDIRKRAIKVINSCLFLFHNLLLHMFL